MATLIAAGNINFTASTWETADATSLLVSSSNNTGLTSTYVSSSTFTPGAITIDGIAVWVTSRNASPSGTVSIALDQATVTVTGTEVTIDVADIPAAGNCWVLFKFAAPVTLLAATAYSVKAKTSAASGQVTLNRNSTANNWARLLRTTTTAAPGVGDNLYILGEKTGSGAGNSITVTMNNTAATIFGQIDVSAGGFLIYGVVAATAYLLKMAGNLNVRSGGEVNIGTTASRMPADSIGELFFSNSSNVDFGLEVLGSGILRTGGSHNANPWALLAADANAGATSLTTNISTGWKNGDTIGIASTTRTASQTETKALTADASGTALTIAALTNAHGGDASTLVQAELINLTRNVKIHGTSTSLQAYINTSTASVCDLNDTEFYFMGSGTANKRGIDIACTTGSFSAAYCATHDFTNSGRGYSLNASGVSNVTITHCVGYSFGVEYIAANGATSGTAIVISDCVGMVSAFGSSTALFSISYNQTVSNIRSAGQSSSSSNGINISGGSPTGSISGLVSHSHAGSAVSITPSAGGSVSDVTAWRANFGISWGSQAESAANFMLDTFLCFGNNSGGIGFGNGVFGLTLLNGTLRAGTGGLTQNTGFQLGPTTSIVELTVVNTVMGGGGEPHSTADVNCSASASFYFGILFDNCTMASTNQVIGQGNIVSTSLPLAGIRANRLGQTQNHASWFDRGTWSYDAVISDAGPSLRMTPLSASFKLQSPSFLASVASGKAATVSIKVRKSVIGDGAAYNGNQPRLIVRRNYGVGITSDTVLATATVAGNGAFETLSGTTAVVTGNCALEFFVDCDGTAGWVNVDTLTCTTA